MDTCRKEERLKESRGHDQVGRYDVCSNHQGAVGLDVCTNHQGDVCNNHQGADNTLSASASNYNTFSTEERDQNSLSANSHITFSEGEPSYCTLPFDQPSHCTPAITLSCPSKSPTHAHTHTQESAFPQRLQQVCVFLCVRVFQ